jgi:GR25 family glycosyltransferase involved in LPS biosynthesis
MDKDLFLLFSILILLILILYINCNKINFTNLFTNINKIDKIYVINLKKNCDRLKVFMKRAKKANIQVERFDAIYGKDLPENHPYIHKYFVKNHNLNPGQIGCALSHIKIWEDAIKNNYKNIIVFEDDAVIPKDFWNKFNKSYNELPANYDMLLLGCCTCTGNTLNKINLIKANSNGNWCSTGYSMNINYCKKLIERIKKNKINQGIDNYIRKNYHTDNVYIPLPPFILQDKTMESDIIMGNLGNTLQIDNNKSITWGN